MKSGSLRPEDYPLEAVVSSVLGSEEAQDDEEIEPTFGLEYQLRDFMAQNIEAISIGNSKVRLYVDPAGRDGVEYPTAVGPSVSWVRTTLTPSWSSN